MIADDLVEIPGLGWATKAPASVRYDYAAAPSRCPACGGVGIPWGGWFSCDGGGNDKDCRAVGLVSDGRTFFPVRPS